MNKTRLLAIALTAICCVLLAGLMITQADEASAATTRITYDIDSECGTAPAGNPDTYTSGSVPLEDAVPNEGYAFAGWYVQTWTITGYTYSKITNLDEYTYRGSVTIYAFWYYKVDCVYELNGGTLDDAPATKLTNQISEDIGTPVYADHEFYGWTYSLESGSQSTIGNGIMTSRANSGTVTYRAGWYYGISYDADGGTISGEYATSYHAGESVSLPVATRDGYIFNGWMVDGDRSKRIESITSDLYGDLALKAWWIPVSDEVGHGYTMSYEKTVTEGRYQKTYSDVYTYRYYEYDPEKGFYIIRTDASGNAETSWSYEGSSSSGYSYLGMQTLTIGGKDYLCEVYEVYEEYRAYGVVTSTYYEKQYIYQGWIPVKIEFSSGGMRSQSSGSYTLTDIFEFDITGTFDVTGYGDNGISVTGSGSYSVGTEITLTASVSSGTTFAGWYDGSGNLVSSSTSYTFKVYTDMVLYACNDSDPDFTVEYGSSFALVHEDGLSDLEWTVYSSSTGQTYTYSGETSITFPRGGTNTVYYHGTRDGTAYYGFYTVVSEGYSTSTFEWTYNGKTYSVSIDILYSDFQKYRNDDCSRSYSSAAETIAMVTSDDRYVVQVARIIMSQTYGMTETERMNVVLAFVDSIEYKYDSESMGVDEYFKYPLETLYDRNGDCEDTSILFCAIASAMGYRSALLMFEGHMAASVEITDGSMTMSNPATFTKDGVTYYYCETTTEGWTVGKAPDGYTYKGRYYIYSDDKAIMPVAADYGLSDIDFEGKEAEIGKADIESAAARNAGITMRSDDLSVDLDADMVKYLATTGQDYKFAYGEAEDLTDAQKEAAGSWKVYSFTISSTEGQMSQLGGTATIHLKYGGISDRTVKSVKVYYLAEDGTKEEISGATCSDGYVNFSTTHFSSFMIEEQYGSSTSDMVWVIGGAAALVLVSAAAIVFLRRR